MQLTALFCILAVCFSSVFPVHTPVTVPDLAEPVDYRYILHAGGVTPDGKVGSNSLEALEYSYEQGYRVMEMDFCWTSDGQLACVHDWDAYYHQSSGETISYAEFEAERSSRYGFTSMTLSHLSDWLREHPDVVIVTDIKEDCVAGAQLIAQVCPELMDRFCIQVYQMADYDTVAALGFEKSILTVYQMSYAEKTDAAALVSFAESHPLVGLTVPVELIELVPGYLEKLLTGSAPVFVHTVNDFACQAQLLDSGISGIYTDVGCQQP